MGIGLSTHILGLPIVQHRENAIKIVAGSMQAKGGVSLTWDNDCRFRRVNPVIGPDVDKFIEYYVPLGPL